MLRKQASLGILAMAPLTLGAQQGQAEDKPKRTFLGMRGGGLIRK